MAFSKKRPAALNVPYTATTSAVDWRQRSLVELRTLGRFNLRVIAQGLDVFAEDSNKQSFLALSRDDQAAYLFGLMHPPDPHAELIDAMNQATRNEGWRETLADVFATLRSFKRSKR